MPDDLASPEQRAWLREAKADCKIALASVLLASLG